MSLSVRIYKISEFIRVNETGAIDTERSKQLIRQIAILASFNEVQNILLDLRDTTIVNANNMADMLEIAAEFARSGSIFTGKIANVIPDGQNRIALARRFKEILHWHIEPTRYEIFTSFEDAIEWLSETRDV